MALSFETSRLLAALPGIRHAFFGRRGGVSRGAFRSLNVGFGGGDEPDRVRENRRRIAASLGVPVAALCIARQVHGTAVVIADPSWQEPPRADALVAERPGIAIGVTTADCAPVLIADPRRRRVAAIHAGWRGLMAGIIARTLELLTRRGSSPAALFAAVGPCIGPQSYEVGPDFEAVAREAGFGACLRRCGGSLHFDLPQAVRRALQAGGIPAAQIDVLDLDTFREEERFFSYRRSRLLGEGTFGTQLSAILLTDLEE